MPGAPKTLDEALRQGGTVVTPPTLDDALARGGVVQSASRDRTADKSWSGALERFTGGPLHPMFKKTIDALQEYSPMVSEGGPAAFGSAIGAGLGSVAGPPGTVAGGVLGGMAGELGRQVFRQTVGGGPAPQSGLEAATQQILAGAGGAATPEAVAAKFPLGYAQMKTGAMIKPKLTKSEATSVVEGAPVREVEIRREIRAATEPTKKIRTELLNWRSKRSAQLAEEKTTLGQQLRENLASLNERTNLSKQTAEQTARRDTENFVASVGQQMSRTEIANGTFAARQQGRKLYSDRIDQLYREIRDIFKKNVAEVPTGEVREINAPPTDALMGGSGATRESVTRQVVGPIDITGVQDELRPFVERYREALTIAKANENPGATAALQLVDGDSIIPGDVAIDNLASLNKLGYRNADPVFRTRAEGVARMVGKKFRDAFKESIGKMEGGEDVLSKLDQARDLLAEQDRIFRTGFGEKGNIPMARTVGQNVGKSGNAARFIDDPPALKSLFPQLDAATREGVKRQLAVRVLGKNYKDFVKNWTNLDPEVKAMTFTPQQIARGDLLATQGERAMRQIVDNAITENANIIRDAAAKITESGRKKMELSSIVPPQLRDLQAEITETAKTTGEELRLMQQIRLREANKRLQELKEIKKKVITGTVIGLAASGAAHWQADRIRSFMGW